MPIAHECNSVCRFWAGTILALALWNASACDPAGPPPDSVRDRLAQGEPASQPLPRGSSEGNVGAFSRSAKEPGAEPAVAAVNSRPIERREFVRLLIESRGLALLQQMVLRDAARQEVERRGLTVGPAEIDREYDLTLQADRYNGHDLEALTPARREQLIREWTQTRGISRAELAIAMERQACLRVLAEPEVRIDESMLRKEYARVHGERVEVRHIQLAALRVWDQVRQRLAQGDRFEDLVADYSQNGLSRERRGLLPVFSRDDTTVPAVFIEAAFRLEVGQVSNPLEAEGSYHVLKLERRIPADEISFDEARATLQRNLHARLLGLAMEQIGQRLLLAARLKIEDPSLRREYERERAAGRIVGPGLER